MRLKTIAAAVLCSVLVLGFALAASPGQQGTRTPGQMTEAHVWIDNQGREEAIPVDLRDVHVDRPLRVQVVNNDPQYGSSGPVQVRSVRTLWDYQTLVVPHAADQHRHWIFHLGQAPGKSPRRSRIHILRCLHL